MSTYESELKKLQDWMRSRLAYWEDQQEQLSEDGYSARDSMPNYYRELDWQKYLKEEKALKKKYGVEE